MDAIDKPSDQTSLALDTQLSAEDLARADLYGLLALLFYSGPPQELLEKIANFHAAIEQPEVVSSSLLQGPWDELVRVAKTPLRRIGKLSMRPILWGLVSKRFFYMDLTI